MQTFFFWKTLVLVGAECLLFIALYYASRTFRNVKYLIFVLVSFSTIVFDVFYWASGKVIEYQEFLLLMQSATSIKSAILMYWNLLILASVKPAVLLIGFILMPPPLSPFVIKRNFIISIILFLILVCLTTLVCVLRQGAATNKLPASTSFYGLLVAYAIDSYSRPYSYQYSLQEKIDVRNSPYQHIILIIDESIRFDYSPLMRISDFGRWQVFDYGIATSYANSSAPSNIALRKGIRFENMVKDFYNNALIWDYAKNAGYVTHLYDAQQRGRGHDYFDAQENEMIDFNDSQLIESDEVIIQSLGYLNGFEKTFTLIIKKGAHFPYVSHPKDYSLRGDFTSYQLQTSQRRKYLKSVLYQSDLFWESFLKLTVRAPTLVIYTSDHGQNLEDVVGLTHGSTENPYYGEGLVPLVVLTNIANSKLGAQYKHNLNHSSHFNIFPTILEAMGYDSKKLGYFGKNSSLYEITHRVNGFFYGIPFGYFGRIPQFKKLEDSNFVFENFNSFYKVPNTLIPKHSSNQ